MAFVSLLVGASLVRAQNTPPEVLKQAVAVAAKLTSRTERAIAYLTIAETQNKLGQKSDALMSLDLGWASWQKGSDKDLSEGDKTDLQFLFDQGDLSMIPVNYSVEFLEAGSLEKAKLAAASLGNSELMKAYLQGIGEQIRDRFPEAVEQLSFTAADQAKREARRKAIRASLPKLREEKDLSTRTDNLADAANEMLRLNAPAESLALLRETDQLAKGLYDPLWRVTFRAQQALQFWFAGAKDEARMLIAEISKQDETLTGDPKLILRAHFAVEQTKHAMGLPHHLEQVLNEMNRQAGVIPPAPRAGAFEAGPSNGVMTIVTKATNLREQGKIDEAKSTLRAIKLRNLPPYDSAVWLILGAELQVEMKDLAFARANIDEASRLTLNSIVPLEFFDSERLMNLERIAKIQVQTGNKAGAVKTLSMGIAKLANGPTKKKMMHMGDGGNHWVMHDRKSPILHFGAEALARVGDFDGAVTMARSIEGTAHRAIALAGVVRESIPQSKI